MKYVTTVAFGLFFLLTVPLMFVSVALLSLATAFTDPDRHAVHALMSRIGFGYLHINPFWHVTVEGRDKLPKGPCVLLANHQSMADVLVALGLYHRFKYVSKASLFGLPFVGWAMRLARYVSLERGKPHSTQDMLERCRGWLQRQTPVLIYPEGTYAPTGTMLPFKRGAFRLAIEEKVPVVPVLLEGTRSLVVEDGPWLEPRCQIRVRVLDPIPAEALGTDDLALADRVQRVYEQALGVKRLAHSRAPMTPQPGEASEVDLPAAQSRRR